MKKIIKYILLASLVVMPFVSHALFSTVPTETTPTTTTSLTTTTTTNTAEPTTTSTTQTITPIEPLGATPPNNCVTGTMNYLSNGSGQCQAYINSQLTTISFCTGSETSGPCRPDRIDATSAAIAAANQSLLTGQTCEATLQGFPGVDPNTGLSYYYSISCSGGVGDVNPGGTNVPVVTNPLITSTTSLLNSIKSLYEKLVATYKNTYGISLDGFIPITTSPTAGTTTTSGQCYVFTQTLSVGSTGSEVVALTYALMQENFLTQTTNLFDTNVMVAVKRFQEAHATEILSILGLTQGTGVVGQKTRDYLNSKCIKVPTTITNNGVPITSTPSTVTPTPTTPTSPTTNICTLTASVTDQKTGVYTYTFTKNTDGTYKVQLNNPAYGVVGDTYYVAPNFSFNAPNALDLNRQNQGWFNYLSSLPGTAEGNTFYQNMFGSFNNAYYNWDTMVAQLNAKITACSTSTTTITAPTSPLTTSSNKVRYVKVSLSDWDTLPLALREITIVGPNNTIIKPVSVSATDFNILAYTVPTNLSDGNENTVWMATKNTGTDLQVITYDLGQVTAIDKVKVMNYGFTDTRVFVIEVSADGVSYQQIAEVRARTTAPIADKGIVWGLMSALTTVGPLQY